MRLPAIIVALSLLSACTESASDQSLPQTIATPWRTLADGSSGRIINLGDSAQTTQRCWKSSTGFACVEINMTGDPTKGIIQTEFPLIIAGFSSPTLPSEENHLRSGYTCFLPDNPDIPNVEIIELPSGIRYQNTLPGRPWSRSYVEGFVEKNAPGFKVTYFSCQALADFVSAGNREAFLSTAIDANDLGLKL